MQQHPKRLPLFEYRCLPVYRGVRGHFERMYAKLAFHTRNEILWVQHGDCFCNLPVRRGLGGSGFGQHGNIPFRINPLPQLAASVEYQLREGPRTREGTRY